MAARTEHRAHGNCSSAEQFRARMLAQCDEIAHYRLQVERREGRRLSIDQAAMEWIERFADSFDSRKALPAPALNATARHQ